MDGDRDVLRSPLAKRKKMVADRSGQSKLKEAFSVEDFPTGDDKADGAKASKSSTPTSLDKTEGDNGDDEDEGEDENDEDDFLARELGEDWG